MAVYFINDFQILNTFPETKFSESSKSLVNEIILSFLQKSFFRCIKYSCTHYH